MSTPHAIAAAIAGLVIIASLSACSPSRPEPVKPLSAAQQARKDFMDACTPLLPYGQCERSYIRSQL